MKAAIIYPWRLFVFVINFILPTWAKRRCRQIARGSVSLTQRQPLSYWPTLEFIEQLQIELRPFALAEPEAEQFFRAFEVDSDLDVERLLDDQSFVAHFEKGNLAVTKTFRDCSRITMSLLPRSNPRHQRARGGYAGKARRRCSARQLDGKVRDHWPICGKGLPKGSLLNSYHEPIQPGWRGVHCASSRGAAAHGDCLVRGLGPLAASQPANVA